MTYQIPDSLKINGREYTILAWDSDRGCIPTNEELGIRTVSHSTANHSGRIDHFGVWGDQLYLFKIDATLEDPTNTPLPKDARKEILFRYEQFHTTESPEPIWREYRHDFFCYEDLIIDYTGAIAIQALEDEGWEKPFNAPENPYEPAILLEFEEGMLVDISDGIAVSEFGEISVRVDEELYEEELADKKYRILNELLKLAKNMRT